MKSKTRKAVGKASLDPLVVLLRVWRKRANEYSHGRHWTYNDERNRAFRDTKAEMLRECALNLESEMRRRKKANKDLRVGG